MKCLTSAIALFVSFLSISQTIENQDKLVEKFGQDRYNEMQTQNPNLLESLDFKISHGYVLIDNIPEKYETLPIKNSFEKHINKTTTETINSNQLISEIDSGTFNILLYNFPFSKNEDQVFRLNNSQALIIRSEKTLINLIDQQ